MKYNTLCVFFKRFKRVGIGHNADLVYINVIFIWSTNKNNFLKFASTLF